MAGKHRKPPSPALTWRTTSGVIVGAANSDDGTIQTVEGNTGNAVKVKTRDTDKVVGYGYPAYAS
ncbi:hypothetical protein [Actinomadura macra]|uniref:hypothetical protein n=1 Tax=Actinomadura macra TaxID=46164 RepID=UPI000829A044|nr:hypothetical protein [Actinomadura macra]